MTLVAVLILLVILVLAIPVAAGLGWLGLVLNQLYSPISLIVTTGEVTWSTTTSFILVAVPFYVLMGEIMLRTGMAERMYAAIAQWVSWLPGGLMHSNVVACAVWGAPSGSSVATAVTVGTVAISIRCLVVRSRISFSPCALGKSSLSLKKKRSSWASGSG
jgi:TRAP-type mannitol/chloroaromatic compound transport system permease large subunit